MNEHPTQPGDHSRYPLSDVPLEGRIDGNVLLDNMIAGLARIVEGHARELADGTAVLPARNARMIRTHGETLHAWIAAKVTS